MKKLLCGRKHRMIEVVPNLYLCECSSYGFGSYLKGEEEQARAMVERQYGGIEKLRDKLDEAEAIKKAERDAQRLKSTARMQAAVRRTR